MKKHLLTLMLSALALLLPLAADAKTIKLYEEPKDDAKSVNTIDSDVGIIPIFTPDKGDWIKVADPRNGNVGWVKVKDLGNGSSSQYTFTQRFINTGTSPQSYQIIQFGSPSKMSSEQVQNLLKQNAQQQQKMQDNMNRAMQNMMNDMNNMFRVNAPNMNNGTPFIMPVLVIPAQPEKK